MATPYDGKVGVWHVAGSWVGEATITSLCQNLKASSPVVDAVWVKTSNGTVWQGENDNKPGMEINGTADIANWVTTLNGFGLEFHAWCVIKGIDIAAETAKIVDACKVPGVKSMVIDVEPHSGYWQGTQAQITQLMTGVRNALGPNFHIGMSVDPRKAYYDKIFPDTWKPFMNSVHPQIYWELMGRTPDDVITETYNVWGNFGLPIIPVLQGWAAADGIRTAQNICRSVRGATGVSYFRLGVITSMQYQAINEEFVKQEVGPDQVTRSYSWEQIIAPGEAGYYDGTQDPAAQFKQFTSARGHAIKYKNTEAVADKVWAQWNPTLPAKGTYEVSVYVPGRHATTLQARYHIHGVTGVASELLVRMNQNMYYNTWVPLVVYEFSGQAGSGQVNLTDLTSEPDKEIAFTAIRWRQVVTQSKVVQTEAGYDPPMGTASERMSLKVWPGQWTDATGFAARYNTVGDAYHTGADLNLPGDADRDTPVYAPAPGVVTFSGRSSGSWGQLVVIRHDPLPDGTIMWSRLAHVSSRIVKEGDRVDRGQQVANIGNADGQLAYHLHFDLAKTSILESSPGHWPGLDLNALMQNYVDPKAFIEAHRPAGRV